MDPEKTIHIYESDYGVIRLNNVPLEKYSPRFKRKIGMNKHKHTSDSAQRKCHACRAEKGLNDFIQWVFECGGMVQSITGG